VSTLNASAGFFERPSDVVWLPRSWTLTRLKRRSGSALDAGSIRLVQPQDGGSGAVSVRGLDVRPRIPVSTTGTIASPAALSVATLGGGAMQRTAGVAHHPTEPCPVSAAIVRCVRKGLHAARAPRALSSPPDVA
jgi:hypothetical protein